MFFTSKEFIAISLLITFNLDYILSNITNEKSTKKDLNDVHPSDQQSKLLKEPEAQRVVAVIDRDDEDDDYYDDDSQDDHDKRGHSQNSKEDDIDNGSGKRNDADDKDFNEDEGQNLLSDTKESTEFRKAHFDNEDVFDSNEGKGSFSFVLIFRFEVAI